VSSNLSTEKNKTNKNNKIQNSTDYKNNRCGTECKMEFHTQRTTLVDLLAMWFLAGSTNTMMQEVHSLRRL
jgi:hypothetical protein